MTFPERVLEWNDRNQVIISRRRHLADDKIRLLREVIKAELHPIVIAIFDLLRERLIPEEVLAGMIGIEGVVEIIPLPRLGDAHCVVAGYLYVLGQDPARSVTQLGAQPG